MPYAQVNDEGQLRYFYDDGSRMGGEEWQSYQEEQARQTQQGTRESIMAQGLMPLGQEYGLTEGDYSYYGVPDLNSYLQKYLGPGQIITMPDAISHSG